MAGTATYLDGLERDEECRVLCGTYTSDNIHQIAWDCLGYAMPTVLLQLLLDGRGYDSFSGRNVDIMMTGDPRLTELLLKYSSWWFLSGIAVVVVSGMICGIIAMRRQ